MSAGMRRVGDPEQIVSRDPDGGDVVTVIEPIIIDAGTALGIDVSDPAQSPVGVPVVLRRDPDGILRADAATLAALATRDELAAALASLRLSHRHVQADPSLTWLIFHDLPFRPAGVEVVGEFGQRIWPAEIAHPAPGRTRIEMSRPTAGVADLS